MPPVITPRLQMNRRPRASVDDHTLHRRTGLQRFFYGRKKLDLRTSAVRTVLGDDGGCLGIMNTVDECIGRKSAKDYGVRGSDPRTSEHGNRQFRRHAHVNCDAIPLADAQRFQHVCEFLHFFPKLLVGIGAYFAGFAFPDQGRFIFARG